MRRRLPLRDGRRPHQSHRDLRRTVGRARCQLCHRNACAARRRSDSLSHHPCRHRPRRTMAPRHCSARSACKRTRGVTRSARSCRRQLVPHANAHRCPTQRSRCRDAVAARSPRRRRHGAGFARVDGRAICRQRRAWLGRQHGQGHCQRGACLPSHSAGALDQPARARGRSRSTRRDRKHARPTRVREAIEHGIICRRHEGQHRRRTHRSRRSRPGLRRVDRHRRSNQRPRDRSCCAGQPRNPSQRARRDRARQRVLRLRRQIHRRRCAAHHPGSAHCRTDRDRARTRAASVCCVALRRARQSRLLPRAQRPRVPHQRGQHDARLHPDLDVPKDVATHRPRLSGVSRRAH